MKKLMFLIIVLLTVVTAYGKTTRIVGGSNTRVYTAEADPVFDESDANTIDANDINNWNDTYAWGLTFDGNEHDPCFAEWLATFDNNETDPCYKLNTYAVGMNQDVNTTASPQFAGVDAGNLYSTASQTYLGVHSGGWGEDFICNSTSRFNAAVTINPNYLYLLGTENGVNKASFLCGATGDLSITCTGGDIDFGDGNLTTTGTIGGVTMVNGDITSGGVLSLTDYTDGILKIASGVVGTAAAGTDYDNYWTRTGTVMTTRTAGDTLTLTGHLLFTDATYDIGATGATRPRDLFLSRNATIGSLTSGRIPYASTAGLLIDSATLTFDGESLNLNGNVYVDGYVNSASGFNITDGGYGVTQDVAVMTPGSVQKTLHIVGGIIIEVTSP